MLVMQSQAGSLSQSSSIRYLHGQNVDRNIDIDSTCTVLMPIKYKKLHILGLFVVYMYHSVASEDF